MQSQSRKINLRILKQIKRTRGFRSFLVFLLATLAVIIVKIQSQDQHKNPIACRKAIHKDLMDANYQDSYCCRKDKCIYETIPHP